MRHFIVLLITLLIHAGVHAATVNFTGTDKAPVIDRPGAATGLEGVYVLHSLDGVSVTVSGLPSGTNAEWTMFDMRGAAYATAVEPSLITAGADSSTLSHIESDCGYCVTCGDTRVYFWVIDYSRHPVDISAIAPAPEQDCGTATLYAQGSAPRLIYASITGRSYELSRDITVQYSTQRADAQAMIYADIDTVLSIPYISDIIQLPAPLRDTEFHFTADRFLKAWGMEEVITTPMLTATYVETVTQAEQTSDTHDNQINADTGGELGGSAPAEITFTAAASSAAIYREWLLAADPEFYDVVLRTSDTEFTYTFTDMGTYYARFSADNASGSCPAESETYVISIGESDLKCPNAFSPGASKGVNDVWKVSYKSIVEFECYIFNSWGTKLAEFHNPSDGWDGKYRGKLVSPGVYYYVIKARGSDGRVYNLSGDINIIGYSGK
ncbi:MAG: gliding motility-associated C-terminal domain-containing protein [Muribaculaceae bacterium]|nr:gliding motility-associated C-terminal domain-containing protein [Muribaculaceae bacterium]